jgi:hypothetical protein
MGEVGIKLKLHSFRKEIDYDSNKVVKRVSTSYHILESTSCPSNLTRNHEVRRNSQKSLALYTVKHAPTPKNAFFLKNSPTFHKIYLKLIPSKREKR